MGLVLVSIQPVYVIWLEHLTCLCLNSSLIHIISKEQYQKIEAAAKAELGADYKVPHYDLPDGTVKVPAAWMIEQCGWKGRRSGGAAVYDKQPLVIVNYTGDAYPEEILSLERRIITSVKAKFGVELHPEVDHI